MPVTSPDHFDVCVVCALAEEAYAFEKIAAQIYQVQFQEVKNREEHLYKWAIIQNKQQEAVTLHLSVPLEMGPEAMTIHLTNLLRDIRPQFVAMTGICAGDRRKVRLGDLVIAERAFSYDHGKFVVDEDDEAAFLHDVITYRPDPASLSTVNTFRAWQSEIQQLLARPASKRQQRDWLLSRLLEVEDHRLDRIPQSELNMHAPAWRKIVAELQQEKPYRPKILSKDRRLIDAELINNLAYGEEEFPFHDPASARAHVKVMAASNSVRADDPFDTVQRPVRSAVAIDMESAVFYRVVTEVGKGTRALVVKGVCDYADPDKDDSYHQYAAEASAIYLCVFIREYITGRKPKIPVSPEPAPPALTESAKKLYFCCAPEDAQARHEIEKHLAIQVRQGRLVHWHSYDPKEGQERAEERAQYLKQADMVLLLLSPDLTRHDFFYSEAEQAYQQYDARGISVVPVLLRGVTDWEEISFGSHKLRDFYPLPKSGKFVWNSSNRENAYYEVGREIVETLWPKQDSSLRW